MASGRVAQAGGGLEHGELRSSPLHHRPGTLAEQPTSTKSYRDPARGFSLVARVSTIVSQRTVQVCDTIGPKSPTNHC
jgi:hypothetical protein